MTTVHKIVIRSLTDEYRHWLGQLLIKHWGSAKIVSLGKIHEADQLPGAMAFVEERPVGAVTFRIDGAQCEIVTLNSLIENIGIGSALIDSAKNFAQARGCNRLWLTTSNDNIRAIRFYQKRGFAFAAVYPNAISEARKLKPQIAEFGYDGIPIRDEIEFEMPL